MRNAVLMVASSSLKGSRLMSRRLLPCLNGNAPPLDVVLEEVKGHLMCCPGIASSPLLGSLDAELAETGVPPRRLRVLNLCLSHYSTSSSLQTLWRLQALTLFIHSHLTHCLLSSSSPSSKL